MWSNFGASLTFEKELVARKVPYLDDDDNGEKIDCKNVAYGSWT